MESLDPASPMPLYHQVKVVLRRAVESGEFRVGEAIPPERELIERFGVSRITVRQAVSELEAEGLLQRRHGKGTYVAPRPTGAISESLSELTGHVEELQRMGLHPNITVLALSEGPMPDDVCRSLQRPVGAPGWFLHRVVSVGGRPLMLSEVYLPSDLGLTLDLEAMKQRTIPRFLTDNGREPTRGNQRIGAQIAAPAEAALLDMAPGDAVLRVVRVIMGAGGGPLVWFRTLYRADRYEYEVELKRRR